MGYQPGYVLFRESRRVIEKMRDFEIGSKLDRLHHQKPNGPSSLSSAARCLQSFSDYIECIVRDIDDIRVEQLKRAILHHAKKQADLMRALDGQANKKRADGKHLTPLIVAFNNLKNHLKTEKYRFRLNECSARWTSMMTAAREIWGERL